MSNYNNELHKHKAADTIKWIVAFVLIIAIMGAVVCLALQVSGVFDFFKKDDAPAEDVGVEDSLKDAFVLNPVNTKYVKLLAAAASGTTYDEDMQVHLTATLEPENVDDKRVDWSIAFANPSSEWATGKTVTEYVTVTPTTDGSLEADVQGLKAFGEQIIITCTSRAYSEAKATCTVDCISKYALKNTVTAVGDGSSDATVTVSLTKTDGTIDCTNTLSYSLGYNTTAFKQYQSLAASNQILTSSLMQAVFGGGSNEAVSGLSHQITLPFVKSNLQVYDNYSSENKENFYKKFFSESYAKTLSSRGVSGTIVNRANTFIKSWLDYILQISVQSVFELKLTLKSINVDYGFSKTNTVTILIQSRKNDLSYVETITNIKNSLLDAVSSVELSQNGIVF